VSRPPLEAEHEALFHSTLIGVALVSGGRFMRVNDEFVRISGCARFDLETQSASILAPESGAADRARYEREYTRPDGQVRSLLIEAVALEPGRYIYSIVDVTERQRRAAELENARALLVSAVDSMSDGFVLFDPDDRIVLCNQVYTAMLEGFGAEAPAFGPPAAMAGMHVETIIRKQVEQGQPVPAQYAGDLDRWVADRVALHRLADGRPHVQELTGGRWVQSIRHRTPDGGMVVLRSDITAFKERERAAELLAQHDELTGLPNRRLLPDRLGQALARARRNSEIVAVLLIDLDDFKPINDNHGHTAGDEVLRLVADRLKGCLRTTDTVARFGGDEFVVIAECGAQTADVNAVAEKILDAVSRSIPPLWTTDLTAPHVTITCSVGISQYPRDSEDPETLIKLADLAMYQAKQSGRGRLVFYRP
jgi:diguanylate cyclase (GGDEF)-like protein